MPPFANRVPVWVAETIATLAVKRGERVLVADDLPASAAGQLARSVGAKGIVIVAARQPAAELREAADAVPALRVLDLHLTGNPGEDLGRFDAYLAAPALLTVVTAAEASSRLAGIGRHALRLGGRLVLDLPGRGVNDDVGRCLAESGHRAALDAGALAGFEVEAVRNALTAAGLRAGTAHAHTSLEPIADATALVELAEAIYGKGFDRAAARIVANAILAGRAEPAQTVWRRVRGMARR